jgi:AGZA family xanthine/uracil permease-like MFS transporter
VGELRAQTLEEIVPAFLTIVMIPLTFSITQGLLWGFVSYTTCFLLAGRRREIDPWMYGLAILSVALLAVENGR